MYINLSISPVFPAHYANSRRIACDAWNKIKDTEYTLNATSYGWWQDRIYITTTPTTSSCAKPPKERTAPASHTGIITGIYICGDDFSSGGPAESKSRAEKFLTNPRVNAAATGEAFRPVEGDGIRSEDQFVSRPRDGCDILRNLQLQRQGDPAHDRPATLGT